MNDIVIVRDEGFMKRLDRELRRLGFDNIYDFIGCATLTGYKDHVVYELDGYSLEIGAGRAVITRRA